MPQLSTNDKAIKKDMSKGTLVSEKDGEIYLPPHYLFPKQPFYSCLIVSVTRL
ncbi:hypothetical protein JCM21714_3328 [Gracilibacillus boraciitolerans JCM 21714]|uniref:Uncharacterized protein n=1 Tax=Gracilibacillus boraciitolerans JCM 21714 TaxID=1298598 RepID=W4VLZ8_9BACI|nr:hypothetical protein JCM21714_3328 [Gracilibacillus boraciitolerans JCM 21714]